MSELRVVAFAQFAKKTEKIIVTLWVLIILTLWPKTYFSQRNQMAITLS